MKRFWFLLLAMWLSFGQTHTASAHGLEARQLSVLLDGGKAQITLVPYATAFPLADDNGDGLLSVREVETHFEPIKTSYIPFPIAQTYYDCSDHYR